MSRTTNANFTCIHGCCSQKGCKMSNQTANTVAKIADGQVMINHKRFAINLSCFPKIPLSGEGL